MATPGHLGILRQEGRDVEKEDVLEIVELWDTHRKINSWHLAINGNMVDEERAFVNVSFDDRRKGKKRIYDLHVKSGAFAGQLLQYKLTSFPDNLAFISFPSAQDEKGFESLEPEFAEMLFKETGEIVFTFKSYINVYEWNRYYTFSDYLETLRANGLARYPGFTMPHGIYDDYGPELIEGVQMRLPYRNTDKRAIEVVDELAEICHLIYHETILSFSGKGKHSVDIVLDLPPDVRVACEQYLLYFVQFLRDLGVEASSELKHDAGKVLFSVTPDDKDEALDKIRTALEVYLCLPSGKLAVVGDDPVEIQRLSANIHHLQGQLMLAHATLQHKDAAIQLQQATIQHQQLLLAQNVITQAVVDIIPQKVEDKEEFLGGAFALTQYEDKGM